MVLKSFLYCFITVCTLTANAQTLTVKKVKGSQAIVEVTGGAVKPGETFDLGPTDGEDFGDLDAPVERRSHLIGISGTFFTGKSEQGSSSNNRMDVDLQLKYGWNKQSTEFGGILLLTLTDSGSGNSTGFGGGGFFDYNFTPNKAGKNSIFGIGFTGTYSMTNNAGGTSSNTLYLFPSGFWKWFFLKNSTALRLDAGYRYNESGSGTKTKTQGISALAGFSIYF